jgi:hypothetical protein
MSDKNKKGKSADNSKENNKSGADNPPDLKELEKEAEKERTRKPGSQSYSSDKNNSGRGGGK